MQVMLDLPEQIVQYLGQDANVLSRAALEFSPTWRDDTPSKVQPGMKPTELSYGFHLDGR
jgi:hypothetical protein